MLMHAIACGGCSESLRELILGLGIFAANSRLFGIVIAERLAPLPNSSSNSRW